MTFPATRRSVLTSLGAAGLTLPAMTQASAQSARLETASGGDQSNAFQRQLRDAAAQLDAIFLPPGRYRLGDVDLPDGTVIGGVPGRTVLVAVGAGPILRTSGASRITLSGLTLDGDHTGGSDGLLVAENCERLVVEACEIRASTRHGLTLRDTGGRIAGNLLEDHGEAALFSTDATGLTVAHNTVRRCGDNGILVWSSSPRPDGTIVSDNRIADIRADAGGTGENGNGVNVYRAADVSVTGNHIADCAFSAVRDNGGANIRIAGNTCLRLGEVAIYAEFAFDGAVITDNIVDDAAVGISITNFDEGGRLAVCANNIVRNIRDVSPTINKGVGISVEADASVTGNVIERVPDVGLSIGWGPHLRDVTASGNTIREAGIGIGVSVADGAGGALVTGNTLSGGETPMAAMVRDEIVARALDDAPNVTLGANRIS